MFVEVVGLFLPRSVALNPYFYASEDHLFTSSKVNPKLNDISILDWVQSRLLIWLTQPDVIKKGAAAAGYISDVPLAICETEFAVFSTDDF